MKILITTDLLIASTNGVVTLVRNLWEGLKNNGHDVRILTLSDSLGSYKEGSVYYIKSIPIGFIYPDMRMLISYRSALIGELIEWKPDIIHSQCEFFSFQFAKHIAKFTDAPIVHTYHTLYEGYVTYVIPGKVIGEQVVKKLSCLRLRRVNRIIAPTCKMENTLRGYGVKNTISVVPSGISLEQHNYRVDEKERRKKRQIAGMVEPAQVQEYYQLADVFVSASTSETQGLTYIEATANGLPLLCRQDECLNDIIKDGINGYQYTSGEEFRSKLKEIIENEGWRIRAGKYSEEIAEAFDKSHFADVMETIYESAKEDFSEKMQINIS